MRKFIIGFLVGAFVLALTTFICGYAVGGANASYREYTRGYRNATLLLMAQKDSVLFVEIVKDPSFVKGCPKPLFPKGK